MCSARVDIRERVWHDAATKSVVCLRCLPEDPVPVLVPPDSGTPAPVVDVPSAIDAGTPGLGSRKEYDRRVAKREQAIEARWGTGRMGRFVKFVSDDPQSTTAWAKGARGEELLGQRLNDELDGKAVVLHDRKMPGTSANIDHIVIGPNGVWVIDAKRFDGEVELRDVGGRRRTDLRLYVNNRDQTKLTAGLDKQHDAVRAVLDDMLQVTMPIERCLCFVKATWPLIGAKPFTINGVTVTWPAKVVEQILQPGPVTPNVIEALAVQLSTQLRAGALRDKSPRSVSNKCSTKPRSRGTVWFPTSPPVRFTCDWRCVMQVSDPDVVFAALRVAEPDVMERDELAVLTTQIAAHKAWCESLQVRVTRRQRAVGRARPWRGTA